MTTSSPSERPRHAGADGVHHAGAVRARDDGQGARGDALAQEDVAPVEGRGPQRHDHLARAGDRVGGRADAQDVGGSGLGEDDGVHGGAFRSGVRDRRQPTSGGARPPRADRRRVELRAPGRRPPTPRRRARSPGAAARHAERSSPRSPGGPAARLRDRAVEQGPRPVGVAAPVVLERHGPLDQALQEPHRRVVAAPPGAPRAPRGRRSSARRRSARGSRVERRLAAAGPVTPGPPRSAVRRPGRRPAAGRG